MASRLRILLIAAVMLSTILVGMRETLAAVRAAISGSCSVEGEAFRGSREDDSGTRSEQVEEDDGDGDEEPYINFLGAAARDCRPDPAVGGLMPASISRVADLACRDTLVRGPPAQA